MNALVANVSRAARQRLPNSLRLNAFVVAAHVEKAGRPTVGRSVKNIELPRIMMMYRTCTTEES